MQLEVGMYVRTKYGIVEVMGFNAYNESKIAVTKNKKVNDILITPVINLSDIIGEPSFDIMDMIKEGDYVNGHKVMFVNDTFTYASVEVETNGSATCEIIPKKNIKSIVTKEQFKAMEYKIEE